MMKLKIKLFSDRPAGFPGKAIIPSLIILLPIIGYWVYSNYVAPISPYYQSYDPEFQYFLNSMAILRGGSYTYIDHPGTPLEIIGTIILLATRLFLPNHQGSFILYHLQHPELFLGLARGFIVLSSLGCALLFFYTARESKRLEDVLIAASLVMMFFVIHPDSFSTLTIWSHNSFNFAFGTLLLIILFGILDAPGEIPQWKIAGIGLGMGALTSITIYFAAWIAGALIAIMVFHRLQKLSWRKTILAAIGIVASSLAGFFLATLPILNLYPAFGSWITGLIFHQGIYGSGAEGITSPSLLLANFSMLVRDLPILFAAAGIELFLLLFALIRWRREISQKPRAWAMAAGLTFMLLLLTVVIAKHPMDIYMLSLAAILPVLMMTLMDIFQYDPSSRRVLGRALIVVLLAGLVISFSVSLVNRRNYADYIRNAVAQTSLALQNYGASTGRTPDELYVYWTYGTYSPCQSLQFGDNGTSEEITNDIKNICDHQRGISIWANRVKVFQKKWDILITRTGFMETYPFLKEIGTIYKIVPNTGDEFGSIVIISNTK